MVVLNEFTFLTRDNKFSYFAYVANIVLGTIRSSKSSSNSNLKKTFTADKFICGRATHGWTSSIWQVGGWWGEGCGVTSQKGWYLYD